MAPLGYEHARNGSSSNENLATPTVYISDERVIYIQQLYGRLGRKDSATNLIDAVWTNIIAGHFPDTAGYIISTRTVPPHRAVLFPDLIFKQVSRADNPRPFSFIAAMNDIRIESTPPDPEIWGSPTGFLNEQFQTDLDHIALTPEIQIGLVAMGRWVRFYRRLRGGLLDDYWERDKVYEIHTDVEELFRILADIRRTIEEDVVAEGIERVVQDIREEVMMINRKVGRIQEEVGEIKEDVKDIKEALEGRE